jgi:hypothetical protein
MEAPIWIMLGFLAVYVCQIEGQTAANEKPHIFFIAVDDMGKENHM